MKKLLSLLAVFAIVLTCCLMGLGTVFAAPNESSEDDFLVFEGVLEEYIGAGGDVVIPASLGIKEIAEKSFYANKDITSIVIPEGVEVIGYWAFNECTSLESVTLPYSLEQLSEHSFSSAPITEITIPGNVDVVGYGAFSGCIYLKDVTLSYGVKEIQVLAFQGNAIERLVFPKTVELICGGSLTNCKDGSIGQIEFYICNPYCEVGPWREGSNYANKHQWGGGEYTPWSDNKGDAEYRIYVPSGSDVEKLLNAKCRGWMDADESSAGDGLKIMAREQSFFDELPENQEGYGTPKPGEQGSTTTPNPGVTNPSDPGDGGADVNNNNNNNSNSNNSNNNANNSGVNNGQQGTNSDSTGKMLIIVVAIFGGIILIAIIAVVILAATGVLFGKKKAPQENNISALDLEAIKQQLREEMASENAPASEETASENAPASEKTEE